jgi:hypothetical protein
VLGFKGGWRPWEVARELFWGVIDWLLDTHRALVDGLTLSLFLDVFYDFFGSLLEVFLILLLFFSFI